MATLFRVTSLVDNVLVKREGKEVSAGGRPRPGNFVIEAIMVIREETRTGRRDGSGRARAVRRERAGGGKRILFLPE